MLQKKKKLHHGRKKRGFFLKFLFVMVIFAGILGVYGYMQYKKISTSGRKVIATAKTLKDSLKNNDIDEVNAKAKELKNNYASFQKDASGLYFLRFVPVAGAYVSDFRAGVEAGAEMMQASIIGLEAITPYADLIGFKKGGTSFADKSADDRIQTAVLTLDKVLVKVDDIADHVDKAKIHIDTIDPNRYPEKIKNTYVRGRISQVKEQFDTMASLFVDAKPLIKKFPEIMGSDREKTYIVLFENDAELRPTGGFLTAYAVFKINKGKIQALRSKDIYDLDNTISKRPPVPEKILHYHTNVKQFFIRDSNLSPDFEESMKLFDSLYQNSSAKIAYDGIIAVDTNVLVDTLKVLGDTEVRGTTFSSQIDKRCDCPQVIYKLLDEIDRPVNYIKEDRKGILGDLLYVLMQKALGFSPSQYWGPLSQEMIKNMQEKHILVYMKDPEMQKAIEAINYGGKIRKVEGDYLHVNDTNFAGAKSNLFVDHAIKSETEIKGDGTVERTLTLTYKNPYKHSDCNLEKGLLCINATLPNWLRIYVPKGAKMTAFQGSEKKVQTYDELDKTVFEGFLRINPKGTARVIVKYTLPFKVKNVKDYTLLIQKQPGTKGHAVEIEVNGRKYAQFDLTQDKSFKVQ